MGLKILWMQLLPLEIIFLSMYKSLAFLRLLYVDRNRRYWQAISAQINSVELRGGCYRHVSLQDVISHAWYAFLLWQSIWLHQLLSVSLGVN